MTGWHVTVYSLAIEPLEGDEMSNTSTARDQHELGGASPRSSWPGASPTPAFQRSAGPPAELSRHDLDEMQARCVHIYGLLRAGLITPSECHQAITVLEHQYGVR